MRTNYQKIVRSLSYLEMLQPSLSHLPKTKDSQSTHCDTVGFVS